MHNLYRESMVLLTVAVSFAVSYSAYACEPVTSRIVFKNSDSSLMPRSIGRLSSGTVPCLDNNGTGVFKTLEPEEFDLAVRGIWAECNVTNMDKGTGLENNGFDDKLEGIEIVLGDQSIICRLPVRNVDKIFSSLK